MQGVSVNKEVNSAAEVKSAAENKSADINAAENKSEMSNDANNKQDIIEEYDDIRSVTVVLVKNYSLYRKINDKTLDKKRDFIGSSIESSRILSSNRKELEAYFPQLVGVDINNPEFMTRVKKYLNNIRIGIDEFGHTFDISYHYYNKADYLKIAEEERRINEIYNSVNRADTVALRKALKAKIESLNKLETTKCTLGYPHNIDDYLMYRHCLLYKDIAKDTAFINVDKNIRFYFKDDRREEEKMRKYRKAINDAKSNYVKCIADDALFDAVYIQYCIMNSLPILSSLAENKLAREIKLDRFSADEPVKFNKICSDKDIKTIAYIELLIAKGELVRTPYSQNINTVDGEPIGGNMNEAVQWFNNPENSAIVKSYYNKLKLS